jgi:ribosome-associated translation inhibitor RaiA
VLLPPVGLASNWGYRKRWRLNLESRRTFVIVQIHTDSNIESSDRLKAQVESLVAGAVGRFGDRVSRVQVHLGDENSSTKGGANDKRCMMEARLDGRPPVAVTQQAPTLEQAMDGAAEKLERTIGSMLDRLRDR